MSSSLSSTPNPLARELRRSVRGDVRFDLKSRVLYGSDASIFRRLPIGVVCPLDDRDVRAVIAIAAARGVPVMPRGAGTSLAGQTVGEAIVLDCSRHMDRILAIDADARRARVEPGVVLASLNAAAAVHGLQFGPDVATADRACLGGMIGNNSCGAHSIVHGKTVDHVESLRVVLADGEELVLGAPGVMPGNGGDRGSSGGVGNGGRRAALERGVREIVDGHRSAIERDYPAVLRRVMGYNLDAVLESLSSGALNLAPLIVGSEGTLATVVEATVGLVPVSKRKALLVNRYPDIFAAVEQLPALLACRPSAIELLDHRLLALAREAIDYRERMHFARGDPGALLVIEFAGDEVGDVATRMAAAVRATAPTPHVTIDDPDEQADVWAVRKAGLGILLRMRGAAKPVGFVEDTAVAPERLGDYLRRFQSILDRHGVDAVFYGHASVGCLHIRPVLDLKQEAGIATMRAIADEVAALVAEFGGALSGEHGDGILRSPWIPALLGADLHQAFGEVKALFDPKGLMNPGKIVDPPPFPSHLRARPDETLRMPETELDFGEAGGYTRAVELCNGNGLCRKTDRGGMCPSYMVTREEEHSTRGRAQLLFALLSGELPPDRDGEHQVREALDLCLQCKACKRECPTGVDMAKLKVEFMASQHARRGVPLADRFYGHFRRGIELAARLPRLTGWMAGSRVVRAILERTVGLDRRRSLPTIAPIAFRVGWEGRELAEIDAGPATVVLLDDEFTNHLEPGILAAAARVLAAAGERVKLPDRPVASGRALISRGLLRQARHELRALLDVLEPDLRAGLPIVGLEPSCLLTFRDELTALLPEDPRASLLRDASQLFDEYMRSRLQRVDWKSDLVNALVHPHCHRAALAGTESLRAILDDLPGVEAELLDAGCCGMAGSFGYDRRHFDLSIAVGERVLLPAVRRAPAETLLIVEGTSCRHQVHDATGRRGLHPAELLALRLPRESGDV